MHPSSRRAHGIRFDRVSRGGRARRCAAAKSRAGGRFRSPRRPSARRRSWFGPASARPSSGVARPATPRRHSAALRLRLSCRSGAARGFPRCSSWEAAGGGVRARSRGGGAPSRLLCGRAESDQKVAGLHSASSASRSVLAPQPLQLPARRWACSCWSTGFSGQPLVFPDGTQAGTTQGPRLGRRSHALELETARRRPGAPTAGELRHALQARRRIPLADLVRPCPRDRPCGYCNGWGLYMPPSTWPHSANRRVASVGGCPRNVRCSWLEAEGTSQRLLCPPHRLRQLIRGVRIGGRAHAKRSGARPTHSGAAATCTARPLPTDRASPPSLDATAAARGLALVDSGPFHVQQHPMACVCTAREPRLKAGVAVSA